jgi:hypothetical protein
MSVLRLRQLESQPNNISLGTEAPADAGGVYEVDAVSSLSLVSEASLTTIDAEAEVTLVMTDAASTTTPWHKAATSTLAFTITVGSSIRMVAGASTLALVSEAATNVTEVSASSALALVSAASVTIYEVDAESTLAITDTAHPGMFRETATDTLVLVQTVAESGVRRTVAATSALALTVAASTPETYHKSASSAIVLVSASIGLGAIYKSATDTLTLTDEARSGIWMASAVSGLALLDSSRKAEIYEPTASDTLSLTDAAACVNLHVYAASTLALTDEAETHEKFRSATTTIDTLTDTATAEVIHNAISVLSLTDLAVCNAVAKLAESELVLTQEARSISVTLVIEENVIELTDEATTNIKMLSLEDTLTLADTLEVNRPWYATAESELATVELVFDLDTFTFIEVVSGLQDSASCIVDAVRSASNILSFATQAIGSHVRADGTDCEAESVLALTDVGQISITPEATSPLLLTQSAAATVSRPAESDLSTIDVAASFTIIRGNISGTNTVEITHAVSFVLEQGSTLCTYTPFIGDSSDPNAPTPPPATYTAAGVTPGFRLQYPADGLVTDELVLRNPNLGNVDRLAMVRVNRETRGGTLIVFADPIWAKTQSMLLSFSGLSFQQGQDLMTFMETHLGEEIKVIDWEDRLWRGVIINPQDPVVQDGPGCQYTASYEFEGEKV